MHASLVMNWEPILQGDISHSTCIPIHSKNISPCVNTSKICDKFTQQKHERRLKINLINTSIKVVFLITFALNNRIIYKIYTKVFYIVTSSYVITLVGSKRSNHWFTTWPVMSVKISALTDSKPC